MLYQLLIRACQLVHSIDEGRDLATIDWKLETNNFDHSTVRNIVKQIYDDTTAARVADHIKAAAQMWCSPLQAAAINETVDWELQNRHFLSEIDDDDSTPPAATLTIPHEQPAPLPAQPQATPTRRQGAPKKQLFTGETLDAKRTEFLREYNLRFPNGQKTITTSVASDDFNQFVINMALRWGDEFPELQAGMGAAWEHFLASMHFKWQLRSKTWRDQIRIHIHLAWKKKKQKQNKPKQT
jgi:hypothetical protein